ncbi:CIR protein [Plasmodium chabaudi chabaudi]|uniref:CIR protein n=1 Tax=Plasmodium chabaudi chabaudi TaxID=31271 RepID=A0A4V0K4J6_PLACU|nr:CIR protein [Plasmodium chabaudi chabaudi]VTZ67857.1 CIR protein [Plasmodium chabaudi chabaudi]|eukprot:XP_016654394.1 CIR protein [Plasmodium chabaudi chabaudi]
MGMKVCETFLDVDNLFINYEANEEQLNGGYGSYKKYCPIKRGVRKCETNYEKLRAISEYGFMELAKNDKVNLGSEYDPSADFVVMGWCHRLYKISKDHNLSLNQLYGNNLGKSRGDFNYKGILNNKIYLMNSNVAIMNMLYLLFQKICETINTYETHNAQPHEHINKGIEYHFMYDMLSKSVNQCDPYIRLLNHLKTIYNEYIKAVIKDNDHDESLRNQLIELSSINSKLVGSEFNSEGCKKLHKKLTQTTPNIIKMGIKMLEDDKKRKSGEVSQNTEDDGDGDLYGYDYDDLYGDDDDDEDVDDDADKDIADGGEKKDDTIDNTSQNHERDPINISDQSSISNGDPNQPKSDTPSNTCDSNGKEKTLENSQSSDKSPGSPSDEQLTKDTPKESNDTTKEDQDSTQKATLMKKDSIIDPLKSMKPTLSLFKLQLLSVYNTLTDIGNNAHEKTLQTLQNTSSKLTELVNKFNNPISQPDKETVTPPSGDNKSMPKDSGSDPPSSDDPSVNPPPMLPNSQPEPEDHSNEDKEEPSNDEKTDEPPADPQEPPIDFINTTSHQVTKLDNSGNNIYGIISENVNSMDILKKHKLIAFSVIGIVIPITLAIMYKYLSPWRTKKSKRKTKMKKIINLVEINKTKKTVINSINGKRPMQIIISSSTKKKQTKKIITSVYGKNFPLLNIYKLMEADPLPFINLFFLLIFFVYKRKDILLNDKFN